MCGALEIMVLINRWSLCKGSLLNKFNCNCKGWWENVLYFTLMNQDT